MHKNLIKNKEKVLLAVSGGIDSMVMLDLFQKTSNYKFAVAHCNFQLRGNDSDQDELFVRNYCKDNRIDFYSKSFNTHNYADLNGISIQMAARELRYQWFEELAKEKEFQKIALAQHLDDQVETFFINLIRGTGIAGIHGIAPINGKLIRPLLFSDRKNIEKYQKKYTISFREDQSNKSNKYLRNYIRHNIAPEFEKLAPNFSQKMNDNIQNFRDIEDFVSNTIHQNLKAIIIESDQELIIDINKLRVLDSIKLHIRELISKKGFNEDTINKVSQLILNPISGKHFESKTHELLFDRDHIIIRPKKTNKKKEYLIEKGKSCSFPIKLETIVIDNKLTNIKVEQNVAFFDYDKLQFPLSLRRWKKGDTFIPFGMNGRKKVSDYFIDQKLSKYEKDEIWILLSANEIIWIVGHRASNRYRINKQTKKIYKITYNNGNN